MDKVIKKIDKKIHELKKQMGTQTTFNYITQQKDFVKKSILPPTIGSTYFTWTTVSVRTLMKSNNTFTEEDKLKFLLYFDTLKDAFKENKPDGFIRITAMAYMVQMLIEHLRDNDILDVDDELSEQFETFRTNLENWMRSISERKKKTGKWGLSGDNYNEIDNFREMTSALLDACTVGEWYTAFFLCYYRFLATRIGIKTFDFVTEV